MPRIALHAGTVYSKTDGDRHFVSAPRLAKLYGLRPGEWFAWPNPAHGYRWDDFIHLHPRHDGDYDRPAELDQPQGV